MPSPILAADDVVGSASWTYALVAVWLALYCASWVLQRYPTLLHRRKARKRNGLRFQAIAHRGCRLEGIPENTVAAMNHALAAGAEVLEYDVWLTKDGEVVVFHDSTLARMCDGNGAATKTAGAAGSRSTTSSSSSRYAGKGVRDLAYADLPPLRVDEEGEHWGVTAANRREAQRIPRLEEVLAVIPVDKPMIIEFKQRDEVLIRKVHDAICKQGRKDRVIWFSLAEDINQALRAYDSSIPNIVSVGSMLKTILLYYAGLLPFCAITEDIFGIPVDRVDFARVREQKVFKALPDAACRVIAYVLGGKPPRALIPPGLFAHLRARGMPVLFLGVNDEADLQIADWAGATAVLTDRPAWLSEQIKAGKVKLQRLE